MKLIRKYKYLFSLLAIIFMVTTCMTIEEIIHPDDAKVDSDIEIAVRIKIVADTDGNNAQGMEREGECYTDVDHAGRLCWQQGDR
jgi:hypothetical protein